MEKQHESLLLGRNVNSVDHGSEKILPKLTSKSLNQMSMYLLQPAFLRLGFGGDSCLGSFSLL